MAIDYDLLKDIKQRADIVDVISSFLPSVQKKGKNYVAICPFHDDHDPSMQIDKSKQTFRCYVCQTGGDVFTFVQKYEKCTFEEAVRKVCEIIGFDDPRLHKNTYVKPVDQNLVPIYKCISDLEVFYEYALTTDEGKTARDYLDKRKLNNEQRSKFSLGYALNDGKVVISYLQKKGYSLKNIEETGICLASTTSMSDNNAGRLIFAIKDADDQVVGFSARKINDDPDAPKYVNSPETKIFTKGKILYNYNNAKKTARHDGYIYVVEGFMDVFALDTIGISSCVALMSTKLTKDHIDLLKRLNCEIRLCLDADKPGQEGMMKIISQLNDAGLRYRLVSVPGELRDPDEILKQDGEDSLRKYVSTLVDSFEFAMNYYKNYSRLETSKEKEKVIRYFAPFIARIRNSLEQNDCIYKLADATGFSSNAIREYIGGLTSQNKKTTQSNKTSYDTKGFDVVVEKEMKRVKIAEEMILKQMLDSSEAIDFFETNIANFIIPLFQTIANCIIENKDAGVEPTLQNVIGYVSASELPNKDEILNYLTSYAFSNEKIEFNKQILIDCKGVLCTERNKIYEKSTFLSASKGKTPQEKARLLADYVERTKKSHK